LKVWNIAIIIMRECLLLFALRADDRSYCVMSYNLNQLTSPREVKVTIEVYADTIRARAWMSVLAPETLLQCKQLCQQQHTLSI